MFKKALTVLAVAIALAISSSTSHAQTSVRGYYRSNGTYVQPHYRSSPDGNFWNNWSTYPNINPYTGSLGTRQMPTYGSSYGSFGYPGYSTYR